jgi:hypothetical protein
VEKMKWVTVLVMWLAASNLLAQVGQQVVDTKDPAALDVQREKHALEGLLRIAEKEIMSAVDAMPADKFGFVPTDGEFKGVRTFGQIVKHLSATNYILAAATLGKEPPADAGDEVGPESIRTKAEILEYLNGSFCPFVQGHRSNRPDGRAGECLADLTPEKGRGDSLCTDCGVVDACI